MACGRMTHHCPTGRGIDPTAMTKHASQHAEVHQIGRPASRSAEDYPRGPGVVGDRVGQPEWTRVPRVHDVDRGQDHFNSAEHSGDRHLRADRPAEQEREFGFCPRADQSTERQGLIERRDHTCRQPAVDRFVNAQGKTLHLARQAQLETKEELP